MKRFIAREVFQNHLGRSRCEPLQIEPSREAGLTIAVPFRYRKSLCQVSEVLGSVTRNLVILCAGENDAAIGLQQAKEQDIYILSTDQFDHLINTNEAVG